MGAVSHGPTISGNAWFLSRGVQLACIAFIIAMAIVFVKIEHLQRKLKEQEKRMSQFVEYREMMELLDIDGKE